MDRPELQEELTEDSLKESELNDSYPDEAQANEIKRCNYYTYADSCFIEDVKAFVSRQEEKIETKYGERGFIELQISWRKWFDKYLNKVPTSSAELLQDMPPSWSSSEPLPIGNIVTEGDAGTGKTFSINTLMHTLPDGTVSSNAKKGTEAFLSYAIADTIPNGMDHVIENDTMCKMFRIRFSQTRVQTILLNLKRDSELQTSYSKLVEDTKGAQDKDHAEKMTREHFALAAIKLWPLVSECNHEMLKEFFNYNAHKHRRTIVSKDHPHYSGDHLVPALLAKHHDALLAAYYGNPSKKISVKDAQDRIQGSESTLDQDSYRFSVAMGLNSSYDYPPPPAAMFPTLLFEEDGMAPSIYGDLRKMLVMIAQFMYLPPYMFSSVPIIISSGSTTQSSAIDSKASALEMSSTLCHLADVENTLAYRAEFFRRDKTLFTAKDVVAHRVTCMTLERCLPASDYTYSSMYTHEEHPASVDDPGFLPEGTRLYRRHIDVSAYTQKMIKVGTANLPVTDFVYVADNVVEIAPSTVTVTETGLSNLTAAEAKRNRLRMWANKGCLYKSYLEGGETECSDDVDYYTCDEGCVPTVEEAITQARHKIQIENLKSKKLRDESLSKGNNTVETDEMTVESCDTGAVLASDHTFAEGDRDDVLYDYMVSESNTRRVKKKKKLANGTEILVEEGGQKDEEKTGLTFIVGRATDLLGRKEHLAKRQHAEAIAKELGTGRHLAELYIESTKVRGQEGVMTYDPTADLVVEYAKPKYDSSDFASSVERSTNARILYMAFRRQRFMSQNAPVTVGKRDTQVLFCGIDCTVTKIMQNIMFQRHAPIAFKAMVYAGIIEKYREWHMSRVDSNILAGGSLDSTTLQNLYKERCSLIPVVAREIIDEYDRVVEESISIYWKAYVPQPTSTPKTDGKAAMPQLNVTKLYQNLARRVTNICNHVDECDRLFAHKLKLTVHADSSALFPILKYQNQHVRLAVLQLINVGDVCVVDTGRSACNKVWRQDREKACLKNVSSPCRYPFSMLRQEMATVKNNRKITPTKILQMGVESFQNNLYTDSMCTLKLWDSVLVQTKPMCSAQGRWYKIFVQPKHDVNTQSVNSQKQDKFGLLIRRGMSQSPTLINNMFTVNGGEMMNLPRPFRVHQCPVMSDVIVKTRNLVISSSSRPRLTPTREMKLAELNSANLDELKVKRIETLMMFGCMNPIYSTPASTVAYAQGSTHKGHVVVNFKKIGTADQLVSMTRTTDTANLKVADVMAAAMKRETKPEAKAREAKRKRIEQRSHLYLYRQ